MGMLLDETISKRNDKSVASCLLSRGTVDNMHLEIGFHVEHVPLADIHYGEHKIVCI